MNTSLILKNANAVAVSYTAKKALVALRTNGLSEQKAKDLMLEEVRIVTEDQQMIFKGFICPALVEIFGEQDTEEAVAYAYNFMVDYKLGFGIYKKILNRLLELLRPEELIAFPDKIEKFIVYLLEKSNADKSSKEVGIEYFLDEIKDEDLLNVIHHTSDDVCSEEESD